MELRFTRHDGQQVTVTADDADLTLAEIKNGSDEFVVLRFKPGSLRVQGMDGADRVWQMRGQGA